jgi:glycosidase
MQWDASPGAGFSTPVAGEPFPDPPAEPWLPIAAGADRLNVEVERDDPTSMLSLYRRLIWYRKDSAALRWGDYRSLPGAPAGLYAFLREAPEQRLLVALNFSDEPVEWTSGSGPGGGEGDGGDGIGDTGHLDLSTDPARHPGPVRLSDLVIAPTEGVVIRLE